MKIKVDKEKFYKVKFEHSLDSKDTITCIVYGRKIFRLRNFLCDLGYRLVKYEVVEGDVKVEYELRSLMNTYIKRQEKLKNEIEEAKRNGDVDGELIGEALYRQMRHVIAELFQTMKRIGILDNEEIEFGCVKEGNYETL